MNFRRFYLPISTANSDDRICLDVWDNQQTIEFFEIIVRHQKLSVSNHYKEEIYEIGLLDVCVPPILALCVSISKNVHAIMHAPIGDDYFNVMRSMLERDRNFTRLR